MTDKTMTWGKVSRLFAGVTALSCALAVGLGIWSLGSVLKQFDAQLRFVPAKGVIVHSRVDSVPRAGALIYSLDIKYKYEVDGRKHTSTRYAFGMGSTSDSCHVNPIVGRNPAGEEVTVFYDPDDPGESVLRLELGPTQYIIFMIFQPIAAIAIVLLGVCVGLWLRARRARRFLSGAVSPPCNIPAWGVLRRKGEAVSVGIRLSLGRLILSVAGAYALASLVAFFVLLVLTKEFLQADQRQFAWAQGLAAAAAILLGLLLQLPSLRKARLLIDAGRKRFSLRSPRRDVELPLDSITALVLRRIPNLRPIEHLLGRGDMSLLAVKAGPKGEVPVHVFPAGPGGRALARKAAEALGALTGLAVEEPTETPPDAGVAAGGQALSAEDRERQRKEFADLM